jgi:heme exporter protein B
MANPLRQTLAVARKDLQSELRSRYALNSLGMFVVVSVSVMAFAAGTERMSPGVAAGLIWVTMFFSATTGLGRSFVSEEERGTTLLLRLTVAPTPVYLGKLLINLGLALATNLLIALMFQVMMTGVVVQSGVSFLAVVLMSSLGFAAALTIIAAIIARSSSKGALYPVLGFPVILPLMILGTDLLERAMLGDAVSSLANGLGMLALYTAAIIAVSWILFDLLWKE